MSGFRESFCVNRGRAKLLSRLLRVGGALRRSARGVAAATWLLSLLWAAESSAAVRFVKWNAAGANDGTSWTNAYTSLQSALAAAVSGDELWVAEGTYKPALAGNPTVAFALVDGVALYGGFAGTESLLAQRPMHAVTGMPTLATILSGDLNGDDGLNFTNYGDNSDHVITAHNVSTSTILDGVTVRGGDTPSFGPGGYGGGFYAEPGSPTIRNCTFSANRAGEGGGMAFRGFCAATLDNVDVLDNAAFGGGKGGVSIDGTSGGPFANVLIRNCAFARNVTSGGGPGGALSSARSNTRITLCLFEDNMGSRGGAIITGAEGSLHISRCTFQRNVANGSSTFCSGGAIRIAGTLIGVRIHNCSFYGNRASNSIDGRGGAIVIDANAHSANIANCIMVGNSAELGGAVASYNETTTLRNCTIASNVATQASAGGGVRLEATTGQGSLYNCILWGNADAGGAGSATSQLQAIGTRATASYCIVQGGYAAGTNILIGDPRFILTPSPGIDGNWDGVNDNCGDLRPQAISPAIDSGNNVQVAADSTDLDQDGNTIEPMPYDIGGRARFRDFWTVPDAGVGPAPIVDMGAYEHVGGQVLVSPNPGATPWADSVETNNVQSALAFASSYPGEVTEIWVAAGSYKPDTYAPGDRTASFQLLNGIAIYGGFTGSETARSQRNPAVNVTTLSGDLSGNDNPSTAANMLDTDATRMDNCYHVVIGSGVSASARLDGFTVSGGQANGADDFNGSGGGMYNTTASPTVVNCAFTRNVSTAVGVAGGGGMANLNASNPMVVGCSFVRNHAEQGGAMRNKSSAPSLFNCRFLGNHAYLGGAIRQTQGNPGPWANCLFVSNTASYYAGMDMGSSGAEIRNFTFVSNAAGGFGGAFSTSSSSPKLRNCIFWRNTADNGATTGESAQAVAESGSITVSNSDIDGLSTLTSGQNVGNINVDPVFVRMPSPGADAVWGTNDDDYGDLRQRLGSQIIDAGDGQYVTADAADLDGDGNTAEPTPLDLGGLPRSVDDGYSPNINADALKVDMGAYEYQPGAGATSAIVYVKPGATGANNGTSWANAYTDLQTALSAAANSGGITQQVWVSAGMYKPAEPGGPRSVSFHLVDNVTIYGGFAGTETQLSQRNITANATILSGDLNGDDAAWSDIAVTPPLSWAENSYHVVNASGAQHAVLDGITITHGFANSSMPSDRSGAALLIDNGNLTLRNCRFASNFASLFGGALYLTDPALPVSVTLIDSCTIEGNHSVYGGGLKADGYNQTVTRQSIFRNNYANSEGGGAECLGGDHPFRDCLFENNYGGNGGGGLYLHGLSEIASLTGCRFRLNSSIGEGAGLNCGSGIYYLVSCAFEANQTSDRGGGLKTPTSASGNGLLRATNCVFVGNTANQGGAVYDVAVSGDLEHTYAGCTFSANSATLEGGGVYSATTGISPTFTNCVFWANTDANGMTASAQVRIASGAPIVNYSLVQGGWGGAGILDLDPMFLRNPSDGGDGWTDNSSTPLIDESVNNDYGDLRPYYFSPLIDVGSFAAIPADIADLDNDGNTAEATPLDLAGLPRRVADASVTNGPAAGSPPVDIGAYELNPTPATTAIVRVKTGAGGLKNGTTWTDAYDDLQAALVGAANSGGVAQELWVAAGAYRPGLFHHPRTVKFKLQDNLAIYGGFGGTEGVLSQRDPVFYACVLSGDLQANDLEAQFPNGGTYQDNTYHVIQGSGTAASAILDGVTVTGGNANDSGFTNQSDGGGLINAAGSPTVRNCRFHHNYAFDGGGAVRNTSNSSEFINCRFSDNHAGFGGGMRNGSSTQIRITNCVFEENRSVSGGGGLHDSGAALVRGCSFIRNHSQNFGGGARFHDNTGTIINCRFLGNVAEGGNGGGLLGLRSLLKIGNCIFSGNTSANDGGAYACETSGGSGGATIWNCALAGNAAVRFGGGISVAASGDVDLANSILWNNTASSSGAQLYINAAATGDVAHSLVEGGWPGGTAILNVVPQFVDADGADNVVGTLDDDLRLSGSSPAIEAGRNVLVAADAADLDCDGNYLESTPQDLDGAPRFADAPAIADCPYLPVGSCGTAPIVDMGAYEYGSQANVRIYVNPAAAGGDGTTWATAFRTLRDALSYTSNLGCGSREIWVAAGIYRPDETADLPMGSGDRNATFRIQDGDAVYGGFLPGDTELAQRNPGANVTILSGDLSGDDPSNTSDNSYHVLTGTGSTSLAILDGFIVEGGAADTTGSPSAGGGYLTRAGGPMLRGCIVRDSGGACGGGMDSVGGRVIVTGLTTYANTSASGHAVGLSQTFIDLVGGWTMQDARADVFSSTFNGPGTLTLGAGSLLKVRSMAPCTTEVVLAVHGTLGSTGIFAAATGGVNPVPARWELLSAPIRDFVIAGSTTRWYIAPTGQMGSSAAITWTGNYLDRDMTASGGPADGLFQGGGTLTITGQLYDGPGPGATLIYTGTPASPLLVASIGSFHVTETAADSNVLSFTSPPRFVPLGGFLASNNLGFVLAGEQTLELQFAAATQDLPRPPPGSGDGSEPQSSQRTQRRNNGHDLQDSSNPVNLVNPVNSPSSSYPSSYSSSSSSVSSVNSVVQSRSASADCRSGNPGYQREGPQSSSVGRAAFAQAPGLRSFGASRGSGPLNNFDSASAIFIVDDSTWDNAPTTTPVGVTTSFSDIRGTGSIDIEFGATLVLAGEATLNLSGIGDGVCAPTNPTGGTVVVAGKLIARDRAAIRNTNVDVKLLTFEGSSTIINNDITLLESSTGFGGEFVAEGSSTIACNTITSEGDRYLDLDPDPADGITPNIYGNKIHVIIKQGVNSTQGELLELRTADCDYSVIGTGRSGAYQLGGSSCYNDTWALEKLTILANAKVNLTNRPGFEFQDPSIPVPEAMYVRQIVMHPGAVLNTGLQRLYYQTLVDENGGALNPLNPGGGRQILDHPLLGFSLKVITMEDDTEFAVRVDRRIRDAADTQPSAPPFKEGLISREPFPVLPDYPQNDAMLMRTMATYTTLSASSVTAKGAFARAGEDEVDVIFNYLFAAGAGSQLVVYLSDKPAVDESLVEIARINPPSSGAGSIGSGQFATFSGRFPRGPLNFTRGTYVQLLLTGPDARVWIDDWDPVVCPSCQCGDFDDPAEDPGCSVSEVDYLYLLSELGNRVSGSNNCADRTSGDNYVDMGDLLAWSTGFHAPSLNLCSRSGTNPSSATAAVPPFTLDQLVVAGKADDAFHTSPDQLYSVNQASPAANAGLAAAPPVAPNEDSYQSGGGRLVADGEGNLYQIHGSVGLIRLSTGQVVLPPQSFTCNLPANTSQVSVGITSSGGYELTDAVFDPTSTSIVYVSPVWVKPTTNNLCPYRAVAKISLTTTGCKLLQVYGKNPAVGSSVTEVAGGGCNYVHQPDASRIREIELDSFGNLFAIAAQENNDNDYLVVWRESIGNASEQRFSLSGQLESPSALLVASNGKLYVSTALDGADTTNSPIHRYTINRAGDGSVSSLLWDGAYDVAGMRVVTAIVQSPIDLSVWAVGYSAPGFGGTPSFAGDPSLFTTAKMVSLPAPVSGVMAQAITNSDGSLPLKLPLGAVFSGCGRKGDLNGDGLVTTSDVPAFVNILLVGNPSPTEKCKTDFNGDAKSDAKDLQAFINRIRSGG